VAPSSPVRLFLTSLVAFISLQSVEATQGEARPVTSPITIGSGATGEVPKDAPKLEAPKPIVGTQSFYS